MNRNIRCGCYRMTNKISKLIFYNFQYIKHLLNMPDKRLKSASFSIIFEEWKYTIRSKPRVRLWGVVLWSACLYNTVHSPGPGLNSNLCHWPWGWCRWLMQPLGLLMIDAAKPWANRVCYNSLAVVGFRNRCFGYLLLSKIRLKRNQVAKTHGCQLSEVLVKDKGRNFR